LKVKSIEGDYTNIKITTYDDFHKMKEVINESKIGYIVDILLLKIAN